EIDPGIEVFLVRGDRSQSYTCRQAATRPTLVFSPGLLGRFNPLRGRVYHGRPIAKFEQLRRLNAAGVRVPRTAFLTPELRLDPGFWGEFVVIKPSRLWSSSHGDGVQLIRTTRLRFKAREEYPPDHPGRHGPMLVQQFINTGERVSIYRALTL